MSWCFLYLICTLCRFCLTILHHDLVHCIFSVDLTYDMYRQYNFVHNLITCMAFLHLQVFFYCSDTTYNNHFYKNSKIFCVVWDFYVELLICVFGYVRVYHNVFNFRCSFCVFGSYASLEVSMFFFMRHHGAHSLIKCKKPQFYHNYFLWIT